MKILIVDDIEENLYLLETLLKGSTYEIASARNGIEALDILRKDLIDIIISDVLMPRMDGFQLCRECKKDDSLKKIPFIFYTATYTDKKDEEFALSLGADKFIIKPQEPEILLKIISGVIEEYKKGVLSIPKKTIKEEGIYLTEYNKRLIQKLEKKILDLEKANKILQEKDGKIYKLNQFQENVIHNANVWINTLNENGNVALWNEAAEKMSGYSAEEVIGHDKIWGWLYPDKNYRKEISEKINAIMEKEEVVENFETKIYCKDRKEKIISWNSRNLADTQGKIIGSVALGRDITQRKQAEDKLRNSEEYLKILFDYAPDAYYISDLKGHFIDGNLAAEKMIGFKKEELIGKSFLKLISLVDIHRAFALLTKNFKGLPTGPDEFVLKRKDNQEITVEISTYPVKIKGRMVVLSIARDITERKESQERYRTVFENTGTATVILEEDMTISLANTQFEKLSGYTREEIENRKKWTEFVLPEDLSRMKTYHQARRTGGKAPTEYEFRSIDKHGQVKDLYLKIGLIPGTQKSVASLIDITPLKQIEAALKTSEEKYKTITEGSADAVFITDQKGNYVYVNQAVTDLLGYSREEITRMNIQDISLPEEVQSNVRDFQRLLQGEKLFKEYNLVRKDGSIIPVDLNAILLPNGFVYGSCRDITQRKESVEQIKHLNQVLQAIRNINQLIITEKDRDTLIQKACNILVETRGYQHTWIILLDKDKKVTSSAEVGYGQKFALLEKQIKNGKWPECMQKALDQRGVVITEDPGSQCSECLLADQYQGWSTYTICLKQNRTAYGIFLVSIPKIYQNNKQEQSLFKEAAGDLSFALYSMELEEKRKQKEEELRESEAFIRSVMDNLPIGIAVHTVSPVVDFTYMNDKFPQIYRTTRKKLSASNSFWDVVYEDPVFRKKISKRMLDDIASGDPKRMHWENIPVTRKGKETRYISAYNILLPDKKMVGSTVIDVTNLKKFQQKLQKNLNATIEVISKVVEIRDPYTSGHQERVSKLATEIAGELNLSQGNIEGIRIASLIHDIGKIGIPSEILTKPSKLSDIEFNLIKSHPQTGYEILKNIDFSYHVAEIILQHHEKLNGSGYPNHLREPEIKLEAKILCVADVVEAMSSHRPYRPALGIEVALEEITKNKGILYDPEIVDICVKLFKEKDFKFE